MSPLPSVRTAKEAARRKEKLHGRFVCPKCDGVWPQPKCNGITALIMAAYNTTPKEHTDLLECRDTLSDKVTRLRSENERMEKEISWFRTLFVRTVPNE